MELGTILLDKYRVNEILGTGGMGRVVRAAHMNLQQEFAIKILLPHMAESAETVSRFLREAQASSRLKSEHIARVFDVGTFPDGVPFMVMEYLAGNDLNQILRHHGPQRPQIVCDLMLQACEGIAEAHSLGIVHRDVKPSNFFITTRPDGTMLLKILDFGISKTPVGITELTGASTVIGTPTYMSPEQMKSGKTADQRSDIWSMGIVMYQLLVGRPPFQGESYAELVLKVGGESPPPLGIPLPAGLEEVILRCLTKNPQLRQQDVGELARMLAPYASDPLQGAQTSTRATRILQQKSSRNSNPLTAAGGSPLPLSPAQLTPSRSWPPSVNPGSSLSHGRGQVTHKVRGARRGAMIFGMVALVGAAGAGGYVAKAVLSGDGADDTTHVAAPPTKETVDPPKAEPKADVKADAKADVKADAKADVKADAKADVKADAKTDVKADAKTDVKADAKVEPKTDAKADAKTEPAIAFEREAINAKAEVKRPAEPVARIEPKPIVKPIAKTEPKPIAKTEPKPIAKTEPKPVAPKPAVKKPKPKDDLFDTRH